VSHWRSLVYIGTMLHVSVTLGKEILQFLENYQRKFPELNYGKRNSDLYFFCNIMCSLNELNLQLH
jgi:hypothetical protein